MGSDNSLSEILHLDSAPNLGKVDQDFVNLHGRLIVDDGLEFDQAAMECEVASSGGNSMAVENTADQ